MLLPALSKAREASREVVCHSNCKQIGLALINYFSDHNDYAPPGLMDMAYIGSAVNKGYWCELLTDKDNQYLPAKPLICTTMPDVNNKNTSTINALTYGPGSGYGGGVSYGYNYRVLGGNPDAGVFDGITNRVTARIGAFRSPSQTLTVISSMYWDFSKGHSLTTGSSYAWSKSNYVGFPAAIHRSRATTLWLDGHVTAESAGTKSTLETMCNAIIAKITNYPVNGWTGQ